MRLRHFLRVVPVFLGMAVVCAILPVYATAQSDDAVSLGDLARSLRQSKAPKEPAASNVIDNDNLAQVIQDVERFRLTASPKFSFNGAGKQFEMASPDGTCSLSFNANTTALLSNPYVTEDLPQSELAKLDGPAHIQGDTLEVSLYNAGAWNVREITVGLTIVRRVDSTAADYGVAKLLPAAEEYTAVTEKHSDETMLLHLKGPGAPLATTVFREKLDTSPDASQEWHWAIMGAKGIPPATVANSSQH